MSNSLIGKKIYLRRLQREDLPRTWQWLHQPDIQDSIGVNVPFSPSQQEVWFDHLENTSDKMVFAVCLKETNEHIGNVSLDMIDLRHRNARLSIFLANENLRGQGYGSDALCTLLDYAFDYLNLHKVWCKTDAGCPTVLRFYEKFGFTQEGLLKEHEFKGGRYIDKLVLAKIRGEVTSGTM